MFFSKKVLADDVLEIARGRRIGVLNESPIDASYAKLAELERRFPLLLTHQRDLVDRGPPYASLLFGTNWLAVRDEAATAQVMAEHPLARVHCFEPNANLLLELERKARSFGTMAGAPRCVVVAAASSLVPVAERARSGWPSVDVSEREVQQVAVVRLDSYDIVDYLRPFRFKPLVMDGLCFAPDGQPLQANLLFQSTAGRR
jgi:hypothetical protein